ncbi:MAG: hypothetical protein EXS15_03585 [Phycisphaerales bacterium]|nr:hypothetical protein [Phycisphaerales bacterium]
MTTDQTPSFDESDPDGVSSGFPADSTGNDPSRIESGDYALETQLNARGARLRSCAGLPERVAAATFDLIGTPASLSASMSRMSRMSLSPASWRARGGAGLAVAASLVAALLLWNVPTPLAEPVVVVFADCGGTSSEPVLVSLLAGSECISSDTAEEFVIDHASAMPILRARDASFGDLNSEVQLILASAGGQ